LTKAQTFLVSYANLFFKVKEDFTKFGVCYEKNPVVFINRHVSLFACANAGTKGKFS
jgi:hypothetical protein